MPLIKSGKSGTVTLTEYRNMSVPFEAGARYGLTPSEYRALDEDNHEKANLAIRKGYVRGLKEKSLGLKDLKGAGIAAGFAAMTGACGLATKDRKTILPTLGLLTIAGIDAMLAKSRVTDYNNALKKIRAYGEHDSKGNMVFIG